MKTIYILVDPRDSQIRYVGQTVTSLKRRLSGHISDSKRKNRGYKNSCWIKSLLKSNLKPIIKPLVKCASFSQKQLDECESYWIDYFKKAGCNLNNHENGGLKGKPIRLKETCIRGHKLVEENLYWCPRGIRHCQLCIVVRNKKRSSGKTHGRDKTHCPQGHEYTEENTYRHNNRRHCRVCGREATRKHRLSKVSF